MIIINNKNYLVWGGVVLVALLLGYFLIQGQTKLPETIMEKETSTVTTPIPTVMVTGATESGMMKKEAAVDYTDSGFAPKSITVKVGTTVTWTNKSVKPMWVASAVHPTHQVLPEFDQLTSVEKGDTYSYTFTKVGIWKYHNHKSPSDGGTVVVE